MSISLGMVNSQGAPSVTGSRRRLWYKKGRVASLQVRIHLQIQTQLPAFENLPSITNRNLILGRNKTKTHLHSGISAERATPRPLVSELFTPPPQSPLPKGPSDHPCLSTYRRDRSFKTSRAWLYRCTQDSS